MAALDKQTGVKFRLKLCCKVLNEYSWLLDSYILDFFTENHMKSLPKSWQEQIGQIPLDQFYYLMNLSVRTQNIWPLSILCLRELIRYLSLQREISNTKAIKLIESNKVDPAQIPELERIKSVSFEHPKVRNIFFKHVKPKKRYEIFNMAKTTAEIAKKLNVTYVIDVGSGLGHLSRIMAYGFHLNVCSIEAQIQLTKEAEMMDLDFEKTAGKHLNETELKQLQMKRPAHLNQTVKIDQTADEFVKDVKKAFELTDKDVEFGIVGLHPCGDLAAVLLKLYTECPEAKFINLVGCCYHKLTTPRDTDLFAGFPLTQCCNDFSTKLSYEARALACHAIESYRERLLSRNYNHLKVHCYRATLECLIDKNWPQLRKQGLGNVKADPELTFSAYCRSALKKSNVTIPEDDLESEETLQRLSQWEDIVKFYSLRLMLAPLIETAILLDRKLFLLEKGAHCRIIAAFDPAISPRNQLLISEKFQ